MGGPADGQDKHIYAMRLKYKEFMHNKEEGEGAQQGMLAERTDYLSAGVHIGMKSCTGYMRQFVYKVRDDGLSVFNLRKVDRRIRTAAAFMSRFNGILIVSRKSNADEAITKFAEIVGCRSVAGRFSPGTLTNPSYRDFFEPDLIVVIDPLVDEQAVKEAKKKRIPVIALCDTFNEAKDVDLLIPVNNNGKKAIALMLMLLSREMLKIKGTIKKDSEFAYKIEDFGAESLAPPEGKATQAEGAEEADVAGTTQADEAAGTTQADETEDSAGAAGAAEKEGEAQG